MDKISWLLLLVVLVMSARICFNDGHTIFGVLMCVAVLLTLWAFVAQLINKNKD